MKVIKLLCRDFAFTFCGCDKKIKNKKEFFSDEQLHPRQSLRRTIKACRHAIVIPEE
jgi:hypothetical protein